MTIPSQVSVTPTALFIRPAIVESVHSKLFTEERSTATALIGRVPVERIRALVKTISLERVDLKSAVLVPVEG